MTTAASRSGLGRERRGAIPTARSRRCRGSRPDRAARGTSPCLRTRAATGTGRSRGTIRAIDTMQPPPQPTSLLPPTNGTTVNSVSGSARFFSSARATELTEDASDSATTARTKQRGTRWIIGARLGTGSANSRSREISLKAPGHWGKLARSWRGDYAEFVAKRRSVAVSFAFQARKSGNLAEFASFCPMARCLLRAGFVRSRTGGTR